MKPVSRSESQDLTVLTAGRGLSGFLGRISAALRIGEEFRDASGLIEDQNQAQSQVKAWVTSALSPGNEVTLRGECKRAR